MTPITPETIAELNASDAVTVALFRRCKSSDGTMYLTLSTAFRTRRTDGTWFPWTFQNTFYNSVAAFHFFIITEPFKAK